VGVIERFLAERSIRWTPTVACTVWVDGGGSGTLVPIRGFDRHARALELRDGELDSTARGSAALSPP